MRCMVCNARGFNQCVKEMSEHAGLEEYEQYKKSIKSPLEKAKPRTKVEYVKTIDSIFDLQADLENERLYEEHRDAGPEPSYMPVVTVNDMMHSALHDNLYRKVETEITWKDELFNKCEDALKNKSGKSHITIGEADTVKKLIKLGFIK